MGMKSVGREQSCGTGASPTSICYQSLVLFAPATTLKQIDQLGRRIINVVPPLLGHRLHIQLLVGNLDLAVRLVLELVDDAELKRGRRHRLVEALLHHVVLAHLLVLHLVREALKVLERVHANDRLPVVAEAAALDLAGRRQLGKRVLKVGRERHVVVGLAEQLGEVVARLGDGGLVLVLDAEARQEAEGLVVGRLVEGGEELGLGHGVADVDAEVVLDKEHAQLAVLHVGPAVGEGRGLGLVDVEGEDVGVGNVVDLLGEAVVPLGEVLELVDGALDISGQVSV